MEITLEIPVVIAHFNGKPSYLKFALESANIHNNKVVLIGDESNKDFWINHWDTNLAEFDKYQCFQQYYVKMSDYPIDYETAFWKRMFMLEIWMKENYIERTFLLDSDIVTFANYSRELNPILSKNQIAALMTPKNQDMSVWASSCHFSYWTLEALENFTTFCIDAYSNQTTMNKLENKWKWHINKHMPGEVCEMTLLYLWSQDNPKVANLTRVINSLTLDHNINSSENYLENEYQMKFNLKKITFKNGIPYGFNTVLNKEIKFLCIHCQGNSKGLMKFLYYKQIRSFLAIFIIERYIIEKYIDNLFNSTKLSIKKMLNYGQQTKKYLVFY